MRPVLLAIARDALDKFFAFLWRFDANAEYLNFPFEIALPFVNKGRHLGPAPGSPAAAVEKYHRRRRILENRGKVDGDAVNVFDPSRRKLLTDC